MAKFVLNLSVIIYACWIRLLRFSMPYTPLRQLKPELFDHEFDSEQFPVESDTEDEEALMDGNITA